MKKTTRILAILMVFALLFSSFSIVGSAYKDYKGDKMNNASNYNDVDAPVYTTNQYASMALDEVDRMLAEENMTAYVYIGTIDLRSIDYTLESVVDLMDTVPSAVLSLLGNASMLKDPILKLKGYSRGMEDKNGNDADLQIIYALLNLLGDLGPVVQLYASQELDVGVLNGMIEEYMFDVTELLLGLLYDMTQEGKDAKFDVMDDLDKLPAKYSSKNGNAGSAAMLLLQQLLNEAILGQWTKLDDLFLEKEVDGEFVNLKNSDNFKEVRYSYYDFDNKYADDKDYDETNGPDIDNYDYYGWVHKKYWVTVGLGDCVRVKEGADAPAPSYKAINLSGGKSGYDFIEDLMRQAYNSLLIPLLNRDTVPWLRKLCGVKYLESKSNIWVYDSTLKKKVVNSTYDPTYTGEAYDKAELEATNIYAKMFNFEAKAPYADFDNMSGTFVDNFNDILGDFITVILKNDISVPGSESLIAHWDWTYSTDKTNPDGNKYLFQNICSVARAVLAVTGDEFFPAYFKTSTASEIFEMDDQQVVAYVLRGILNGSVDWMYIDDTCQTIADVCYSAVEQLAWQDIPQYTYTKPTNTGDLTAYNKAIVEKCLDILLDVAIYNINQDIDMNPTKSSANPIKADGLLVYQGDEGSYEKTVLQIAAWAFDEYAPILNLNLKCGATGGSTKDLKIEDFWTDLDTIINSIIPIKQGNNPWISESIASQPYVSKSFIFDNIVYPLLSLNATNFAEIFKRNSNGAFATMTGIPIIISLLEGIFDLVFPGVFVNGATDLGKILNNGTLGNMVYDLLEILGTEKFTGKTNGTEIQGRAVVIAKVALPVVCMLLDLNEDQKFKELENYMPNVLSLASGDPKFLVYNGSSGVNTSYTDAVGDFHFDSLYTYEIVSATVVAHYSDGTTKTNVSVSGLTKGEELAGGKSKEVTLSNVETGQLIELAIKYKVKLEDGSYLGSGAELTNTSYCYIAESGKEKDDDSTEKTIDAGNGRTIKYESEIYIKSGKALSSISGHTIRIADNDPNKDVEDDTTITKVPAKVTGVTNSNASYPFAQKTAETKNTEVEMNGKGGTYFLNPFEIAVKGKNDKGEDVNYNRIEPVYKTDSDGKYVLDENNEKIFVGYDDGVPTGKYTITSALNVGGTNVSVPVNVHIYNDYNLDSIFSRAVAANRQRSDYNNGATVNALWDTYIAALNQAAFLALKPKDGTNFEEAIKATDGKSDNLYEQYATALSDAIEALDKQAVSAGVEGVETALADINGGNNFNRVAYIEDGNTYYYKDPIEYDEEGYAFFSMRDFVPHTFNAYRIARNRANGLIDSQKFYINTPLGDDYTQDELIAFKESLKAYDDKEENKGAVSSIEATYAIHMLKLTGDRLIRVKADKSKLEKAIAMCIGENAGINAGGASYYSAKTWDAYTRACAFAQKINAMETGTDASPSDELKPSMVNEAMSNLIESWKELVQGSDYTKLDAAITTAEGMLEDPTDPKVNTVYTEESYDAFYKAYKAAVNLDRNLARTDENDKKIDSATTALQEAMANLEVSTGTGEPEWSLISDNRYTTRFGYAGNYSPWIDTKIFGSKVKGIYLSKYNRNVDGIIFGLPQSQAINGYADLVDTTTVKDATFELVPNSQNLYSTGALLIVYNSKSEIDSIYMLVFRGDITGDTSVDFADISELNNYVYIGTIDWVNVDDSKQKYIASDVNYDLAVDFADISGFNKYCYEGSVDFYQTDVSGFCTAK